MFAKMRALNFTRQLSRNLYYDMQSTPRRIPLAKIVATIGPASENMPMLGHVCEAGLGIMRINFSHATFEEADLRVSNLKKCATSDAVGEDNNLRAVMLDTQGPEIRTGSFQGVKEVELKSGSKVTLTIDSQHRTGQTPDKIWISYDKLLDTVKEGTRILLDDGAIAVKVERKSPSTGEVVCHVENTGVLGNKKGVNIPGESVDIPAMSEKDKIDLRWGVKNDVDFIAASFVRKAKDVTDIRDFVIAAMQEHKPGHPIPRIISKIESTEALQNFDAILEASDAIMVARGDLGVEIPMEHLTNMQKEMVRRCNQAGKPIVVATQMLESMQKNPRPTRAECTDVYNAIMDGADCVMLSGESAKGKYPIEAVSIMRKISDQAEIWAAANPNHAVVVKTKPHKRDAALGLAHAVVEASKNLDASAVIVLGRSGKTAANVARFRPDVPILAFVPNAKTGRFLQLHRGIHPLVPAQCLSSEGGLTPVERFDLATAFAKQQGYVKSGDTVIIVAAEIPSSLLSHATTMRVVEVK